MELAWDIVELGKFCQKALNELEQFRTQKHGEILASLTKRASSNSFLLISSFNTYSFF